MRPVKIGPGDFTNERRYEEAVKELASMVDVWQHILTVHTRTPGGFCVAKVCREGGTGRAQTLFPCPIRVMATSAEALHREVTTHEMDQTITRQEAR